jgi:hypothetical protein
VLLTVLVALLGSRAQPALGRIRDCVAGWGHRLLAGITAASGLYVGFLGIRGFAA